MLLLEQAELASTQILAKYRQKYPGTSTSLALPVIHSELLWGALQQILTPEQHDRILDYLIRCTVSGTIK